MSESVEQAALRRAAEPPDWTARAHREAAAILDGLGYRSAEAQTLTWLTSVVAVGWLQGVNYGSHDTLAHAEAAFDRLRESL